MQSINCADLGIVTFPTIRSLPADVLALLDGVTSLFTTLPWWNVVLSHAMPACAETIFVAIRRGGNILAVVPMLRANGQLSSLTTPYSCVYRPLIASGLDQTMQIAAMSAFARFCRPAGIVRLDALPAEWDGLAALKIGAREAGLVPLSFDHFGNWYENVAGLSWSAYLLRRPGALRATIRRRLGRAEKLAGARFDLLTRADQMDEAAEAFEFSLSSKLEERRTLSGFQRGADARRGRAWLAALRCLVGWDRAGCRAVLGSACGAGDCAETGS